jgi:hypothetical protein
MHVDESPLLEVKQKHENIMHINYVVCKCRVHLLAPWCDSRQSVSKGCEQLFLTWTAHRPVAIPNTLGGLWVCLSLRQVTPWLRGSICPTFNPGPLPGAIHLPSGTCSFHKAGSPFPAVGLFSCEGSILLFITEASPLASWRQNLSLNCSCCSVCS